jgi:hypothetical protein
LAGVFLWAPAGVAEVPPREDRSNDHSNDVQSLDSLLPAIRRAHPGELSDAHGPTFGPSGDPHYHLKWITPEGGIYWFDADAQSGQVLRTSPGRDSFDDR